MERNTQLYKSYFVLRYYQLTPQEEIEMIDSFESLRIGFRVKEEPARCLRIEIRPRDLYDKYFEIAKFIYTPCLIYETDSSGEALDSTAGQIPFEYIMYEDRRLLHNSLIDFVGSYTDPNIRDLRFIQAGNEKFFIINTKRICDIRIFKPEYIFQKDPKDKSYEFIFNLSHIIYRRDLISNDSDFYIKFEKLVRNKCI